MAQMFSTIRIRAVVFSSVPEKPREEFCVSFERRVNLIEPGTLFLTELARIWEGVRSLARLLSWTPILELKDGARLRIVTIYVPPFQLPLGPPNKTASTVLEAIQKLSLD